MGSARDRVINFVARTSIITVLFIGWACYLVGREWFRASTTVRGHVQFQIEQWIRKDTMGAWKRVLKRPANLISLAALILAGFTLHPKWLLAVVHLWAIPIAVFFFFVHFIFTRLWLEAGRIEPPFSAESLTAPTAQSRPDPPAPEFSS